MEARDFIPYEQALALKELGFDEECFGIYYSKDGNIRKTDIEENGDAPLYQQAFRFFREKYKLEIIRISPLEVVTYYLAKNNIPVEQYYKILFIKGDSIEEAELECLKKLIEIAKQ